MVTSTGAFTVAVILFVLFLDVVSSKCDCANGKYDNPCCQSGHVNDLAGWLIAVVIVSIVLISICIVCFTCLNTLKRLHMLE